MGQGSVPLFVQATPAAAMMTAIDGYGVATRQRPQRPRPRLAALTGISVFATVIIALIF